MYNKAKKILAMMWLFLILGIFVLTCGIILAINGAIGDMPTLPLVIIVFLTTVYSSAMFIAVFGYAVEYIEERNRIYK